MGQLDGRTALVTGGTTGIGLAVAQRLAGEGAHVFVTGRRKPELDASVETIGANATGVQGDVADLAELDSLYDTIRGAGRRLDVLVANAGGGSFATLEQVTEQHFDQTFGINVRGLLFTVQKALPLLNDGGSIIMTGSNDSQRGYPGWSVYAASKAVQQGYARVWAAELKDRGIRVNVLTPGQVATAKQEELFDEETRRQFESLIPRGKMGRPEEIATVALFLASDDSSYVNGMELVADGGTTAI